ncbi:MAG: SURF1 family protein [Steroidobacteraceae bacterium]
MRSGHSPLFLAVAGTLAVLLFLTFVALGTWQVKRRVWKLDLITRVEQRVHAPPAGAPGPAQWAQISAATDEYRHVTVTGTFLDASQTLVQAVTELGAGYWVLTPLRTADDSVVLVNRGFVPADDRDRVAPAAVRPTSTSVTGLLRMTEPRGAFLRHNDPAANHWYSRDVQAIAAARGLTHVAPYFIDARASSPVTAPAAGTAPAASTAPAAGMVAGAECGTGSTANAVASAACGVVPIGGLTVITFHNSHLVYAITWYTLALMVAVAIWLGIRHETRT